MTVSVLDYGVGNLGSILNMLRHLDVATTLASTPDAVGRAERLLLPGVGAFDRGVRGLAADGIDDAVRERVSQGMPLLGVCLGMQLLSEGSAEGVLPGLGLIPGHCQRLQPVDPKQRVPHMGWDWILPRRNHPLLADLPAPSKFYFTHSYHLVCTDQTDVLAISEFAGGITAVVAHENVVGAQFHPEKSHAYGMALLRSFAEWAP